MQPDIVFFVFYEATKASGEKVSGDRLLVVSDSSAAAVCTAFDKLREELSEVIGYDTGTGGARMSEAGWEDPQTGSCASR